MTTQIIDDIFTLLRESGDLSYGEDVSQMAHILQCGHLARIDGASDAMVAAALLHDVGQFLNDAGNAAEQKGIDAQHEVTGAAFLARWFPHNVRQQNDFLSLPTAQDAIRLRRYDDQGKRPDWDVPDLESYRSLLTLLLRS